MLADCVIEYLNAKIENGCDAVQIFDTWAGVLSPSDLDEFVLPYVTKICDGLKTNGAPVIYFPKGIHDTSKLAFLNCNALGIDWTTLRQDSRFGRGYEYVPSAGEDLYGPLHELWG